MPDAEQPPQFPPPMPPHPHVDHEARSRINALEVDMRGLRNQVDSVQSDMRTMRDNQSTMQSKLSSANTHLEWLRSYHEQQAEREKSNKHKSANDNKMTVGIVTTVVVLAEVVQSLVNRM